MDNKRSRRSPQQSRSRDTVEAILVATARVLVKDGFEKLSTNRVARIAGVSVGSLYQYFSSKHELIEELIERRSEAMLQDYEARVGGRELTLEESIRTMVDVILDSRRLDRELASALSASGRSSAAPNHLREVQALLTRSFLAHRHRLQPQNLELAAFLVISSIEAAADSAVAGRPELLEGGALRGELVELLVRYLVRDSASESGVRPAVGQVQSA
ncbi:MAG: TetR/AcrR family transcriptional regulator [Myxococcales bacterium]|nr:TetR/AcrR family transcriptional regulator [Myxococcales bacterium]